MGQTDPYYFDYAASAPPLEEALQVFSEVSAAYFANPSSLHLLGAGSREKYFQLKEQFCNIAGFREGRLLLCSSCTEANNTIIEGHVKQFRNGRILIAEHVHDSIWYAHKLYPDRVDILKINKEGIVDFNELKSSIKPGTSLLCLSHVCNETGAIQPLQSIAEFCESRGLRLLVDGAQALGHLSTELDQVPFSYYTFASHKFGAPKGIGGILFSDDQFQSLLNGGRQEWELRAGTENLAGLAASVSALDVSMVALPIEAKRLKSLAEHFQRNLENRIPDLKFNNSGNRIPGFLSICLPGFLGNELVAALSLSGMSVSTGSACHANETKPSRIILAMGRSEKEAIGTLRITMGRGTTKAAVNDLAEAIVEFAGK